MKSLRVSSVLFPYAKPGEPPEGEYDRDKLGFYTTRIRLRETVAPEEPAAWIRAEYQPAPFDYILKRIWDSHYDAVTAPHRQIEILTGV